MCEFVDTIFVAAGYNIRSGLDWVYISMIYMDRDIPPAEAGRGPQRDVRVAMPRDKQVTW